jgi:hypothetical protein
MTIEIKNFNTYFNPINIPTGERNTIPARNKTSMFEILD